MNKNPSPLKATRLHCLACCLNQSKEVRRCGATGCPLHALRFGKSVPRIRPLKAIAEKCKDCAGDEQPKSCTVKGCTLWPFRLGTNPNRAGLGNHAPNKAGLKNNARTHAAKNKPTAPGAGVCSCSTPCADCACSDRRCK